VLVGLAGLLLLGVLGVTILGGQGRVIVHPGPPQSTSSGSTPPSPCPTGACNRFFSPTSIWNQPLAPGAPLDPNSAAVVGNLRSQEASESLGIATKDFGVPIYTVPAAQPKVRVILDQGPAQTALQAAFDSVPLPAGAQEAEGTDANLAVYQPSTDTMWEFWRLHRAPGGAWHASWGGRMYHVSSDPGYYRYVVSPQGRVLELPSWGAPATSFPVVAGVMTIAELRSGVIGHALALAITHTCAGTWAAPAQRSDGDVTGSTNCVPEGAHFRLDPKLDLAALHLPHFVYMMAVAAQRYGIIINNRSDGFTFRGEDPTQFQASHGYNPYTGPDGAPGSPGALYNDYPSEMLRRFPWSHLELLKMVLRTRPDMTRFVERPG
jgi:hypothetical protein